MLAFGIAMGQSGSTAHEDRQHLRWAANGFAVIHAAPTALTAQIANISHGGALLVIERGALPDRTDQVVLDLRLAGSDRRFCVRAHVVRRDLRRSLVAVAFAHLDCDLEDAIADLGVDTLEATNQPRVLLVDADLTRRERYARVLRISGCCAVEASTPLEAIGACEESVPSIAIALLIADSDQEAARELVEFLVETQPGIDVLRIDPSADLVLDMLRAFARAAHRVFH